MKDLDDFNRLEEEAWNSVKRLEAIGEADNADNAESDKVLEVKGKAEAGDAEAQYQLGCFYVTGKGSLKMDTFKAAEWFRKAAAQGHEGAIRMLKS
jgi:TPR repeat protein